MNGFVVLGRLAACSSLALFAGLLSTHEDQVKILPSIINKRAQHHTHHVHVHQPPTVGQFLRNPPTNTAAMPPADRRQTLLQSAESLCTAFANHSPLDDILSHFSTTTTPFCYEHGLQTLAPFLGTRFVGIDGVKDYFTLIGNLLSYETLEFSDYIVDTERSVVCVRGKGTFTWKSTGSAWSEVFTYRLGCDDEGKIVGYEVWADSGAAYLASKGEL